MATISAFLRARNKKKLDNPLFVMFRHGKVEVVVSTGENIRESELRKGKVVGEKAVVLNELVSSIGSDLQKAYDTVYARAEDITNASIRVEYERIVQERITKEKWDEFLWMGEKHEHKKEAYDTRRRIRRLNRDLGQKSAEVEEIKQAISTNYNRLEVAEAKNGAIITVNLNKKKDLFTSYVEQFLDEKKNNHAVGTKGSYLAIIKLINDYNPQLKIQDVNRVIMYELEDFMIAQGRMNTTIENYTSKIKGILNYFAADLDLGMGYKKYTFQLPIQPKDVVYFTLEQLQDFWAYEKPLPYLEKQPNRMSGKNYQRVKELMMFMCATSLRFVDLWVDFRQHIKEGNIVLYPQKTRKKQIRVEIPLTPLAKSILERNDYKFRKIEDYYFRDLLREFCEKIPSFQAEVTQEEYCGQKKITVVDSKTGKKPRFWQEIGAHTGRRTWVNFAFQSGWSIPEIVGVTGHLEVNTLMTYANKSKGTKGQDPMEFFQREK